MAGQGNAQPVIIKRKKKVSGGGHHGGAWKVAYADFVTAMMAFFLLMWLLNATTEKQRKGLSDYFNPTIPINRVSGGGQDSLGGESLFTEEQSAQNGTGGIADGRGASGEDSAEAELLKTVEKELFARGGESRTMEQILRHVVTRVTDEGLVIELFDLDDAVLFRDQTADPTPATVALASVLAEALNLATNKIAVNGYVQTWPVTLADNPSWELSSDRARAMRQLLEEAGIQAPRFQRIGGFADRKPAVADPAAKRNNRIEIVLLRRDR